MVILRCSRSSIWTELRSTKPTVWVRVPPGAPFYRGLVASPATTPNCHIFNLYPSSIDFLTPPAYVVCMNKLSSDSRARIISALIEGNSIASTCRMTGAAKMTVLSVIREVGHRMRSVP